MNAESTKLQRLHKPTSTTGALSIIPSVVDNDQSLTFLIFVFWNIFLLYFSLFLTKFYLFFSTPGLE